MNISQAGIQFIAANEGFAPQVYNDAGHQAIGFGHDLLDGESFPNGVTREEGLDILGRDCVKIDDGLADLQTQGLISKDCTQNQWDALADFAYNLGVQSLRVMLGHGWDQVSVEMLRWCYVNHVPNDGLRLRRAREIAMFNEENPT